MASKIAEEKDIDFSFIINDGTYTNMRCDRVYGCIECRCIMIYLGVDNNDHELFQCQNKNCSMNMKVLLIVPPMVRAKIIVP